MRESPEFLEVVVGPLAKLGQRVASKKLGRGAPRGYFPRGCLGAFLAELEIMRLAGLGPGAADASETSGLFWRKSSAVALDGTRSRVRLRASDLTDPQPPAGPV